MLHVRCVMGIVQIEKLLPKWYVYVRSSGASWRVEGTALGGLFQTSRDAVPMATRPSCSISKSE